MGTLGLVRFPNPAGLSSEGENLLAETSASGTPISGTAAQDGFGSLQQGPDQPGETPFVVHNADGILLLYDADGQLLVHEVVLQIDAVRDAVAVGDDERRAVVRFRFQEGADRLRIVGAKGDPGAADAPAVEDEDGDGDAGGPDSGADDASPKPTGTGAGSSRSPCLRLFISWRRTRYPRGFPGRFPGTPAGLPTRPGA